MTVLETRTKLSADEVLRRARSFYERAGTPQTAFVDQVGDGYLRFRMELGEVVIAAMEADSETIVRGSASRAMGALSRFFTLLGEPLDVRETTERNGLRSQQGAKVEPPPATAPRRDGDPAQRAA